MIAKQKEKWMEYCELAAKEQDPKKLIALIAEISRLLAQRADACVKKERRPSLKTLAYVRDGHLPPDPLRHGLWVQVRSLETDSVVTPTVNPVED